MDKENTKVLLGGTFTVSEYSSDHEAVVIGELMRAVEKEMTAMYPGQKYRLYWQKMEKSSIYRRFLVRTLSTGELLPATVATLEGFGIK